ncbi:MAG TPA: hypothetical protein VFQ51_14135 [Vicinamibacteria bacterium]|nr:hypothetical protein [Vicinamibacteria bacterium]
MLILQNAEAAIKRALDLLEMAGPGEAPAHVHWIEARILLSRAWEEVRLALSAATPQGPVRYATD